MLTHILGTCVGWRLGCWIAEIYLEWTAAWREFGKQLLSMFRGLIKELRDLHNNPSELAEKLDASSLQFKDADLSPSSRPRNRLVVNYYPLRHEARQIRLIKLLPAIQQPKELRCRLVHVSLDDPSRPHFVALSYCWGDAPDTVRILCNGQLMDISPNLHDALTRMRETGSIFIWADQICINQQDLAERSSQVKLMRNIYSSASAVFAWIGEDTEDRHIAKGFDMARTISRCTENTDILVSGNQLLTMGSEECARYGIPTFPRGIVG